MIPSTPVSMNLPMEESLQPLELKKPRASRVTSVMPAPSPTAQLLKGMDPEQLLETMPPEIAAKIVAEWREAREAPHLPRAREKSIEQYRHRYRLFEEKYTREYNLEGPDLLSPVAFLRRFFFHARTLSAASWKLYRQSVLHVMNERALDHARHGRPHDQTIRALATLIVVTTQPYLDEKKKKTRVKSIKADHFGKLVTHLATGYVNRNLSVKQAQSFAIAALMTGLRPSEWRQATTRPATADDISDGTAPDGWIALELSTIKRKDNEPDWPRTLLIEPGGTQGHVLQHLTWFKAVVDRRPDSDELTTEYIHYMSRVLRRACKTLWPHKEGRWISLYTLRHQARANIVSVYGDAVAAAMMGHSVRKGEDFYTGKNKANRVKGGPLVGYASVPRPGKDCLMKAAEFEAKAEAMKGIERHEDMDRAGDSDAAADTDSLS